MPSLVICMAPAGPASGVRAAFADWSAAGLLGPYLWVEPSAVTPGTATTPAVQCSDGRVIGTSIQHTLTQARFDRVRVVSIVPAVGGASLVDPAVEQAVLQSVLGTGAVMQQQVDLFRFIVTRPQSGPVGGDLVREGWHNIICSPELSVGPRLGHQTLPSSIDPVELGAPAASVIASVAAMWVGQQQGPLDGVQAPFGRTLRLARSWYRDLDARTIEDDVRRRVLAIDGAVPQPTQQGGQPVYIDDAASACQDLAASVLKRHASLFKSERKSPQPVAKQQIGMGEAAGKLASFIRLTIGQAPSKWYSLMVGSAPDQAASRMQSLVFGDDPSNFAVVADGQLLSGTADWQQVSEAAGNLDQLSNGPRAHQAAGDFSPVWSDFMACGLMLVDGGDRGQNQAIMVGNERGVLRHMSDSAPAPDEWFTDIGTRLRNQIGIGRVQAADPLGVHTLRERLMSLASHPSLSREAEETLRRLDEWKGRHAQSYAAQTGAMLANELLDTSREVQNLARTVRQGPQVDTSNANTQGRQRRIGMWMRVLTFALVVMVLLTLLGAAFNVLTWMSLLWVSLSSLVFWFGGSLALYMIGQRDLFADLNRQRQAMSQAEANEYNLKAAVRDLHRLGEGYGQFLEWTRVLGVMLHEPFGRGVAARTVPPLIESGLPMSVGIGRAECDEESTEQVVDLLRRELFHVGWLGNPWNAALQEASQRLGARGRDLEQNPSLMFSQRARVEESLLTPWADSLERDGVGDSGAAEFWHRAMGRLVQPDYVSRLVSQVRPAGGDTPVPTEAFLAGVGSGEVSANRFDTALLTRENRQGDANVVEVTWPLEHAHGLGRRAVMVQLGRALSEYSFDLGERVAPEVTAGDEPEPPPMQMPSGGAVF